MTAGHARAAHPNLGMKRSVYAATLLLWYGPLAAAPVGKVFRKQGNTVEITGAGIARLTEGAALTIVTRSGTVDIRVQRAFHTKVAAVVVQGAAGNIAAGDAVYIKGTEPGSTPSEPKVQAAEGVGDLAVLSSNIVALTPGWDIFALPTAKVSASFFPLGQNGVATKVRFEFSLTGAERNHEYTVGIHLFHPTDAAVSPVPVSIGYAVGRPAPVEREGHTALVAARDFGTITTDASGNATVAFEYTMPAEDMHFQFTVRTGVCLPAKRKTAGCNVVFRSGGRYGDRLERLRAK